MSIFTKIGSFISCLLHENCEYSIKKILTYTFSLLAIYVVIFTDKDVYEILLFVTALLGIRGYERVKLWGNETDPQSPPTEPVPPPEELTNNSPLGRKKSSKRLLTD